MNFVCRNIQINELFKSWNLFCVLILLQMRFFHRLGIGLSFVQLLLFQGGCRHILAPLINKK